jgi:hypothetical protein
VGKWTNADIDCSSGSGRIQVAQFLLGILPLELASISEPEDYATEYLHYRQFFNIWETLARIVECQSLEVQHMNKDTRVAWLKDHTVRVVKKMFDLVLLDYNIALAQGLVDQAHEQIVKLLTSEWLVSDVEDTSGKIHTVLRLDSAAKSVFKVIVVVAISSAFDRSIFQNWSSVCTLCWCHRAMSTYQRPAPPTI